MISFDVTLLEGLLSAGVTIGVEATSSYEGNFSEATSVSFEKAWDLMENDRKSVGQKQEASPPKNVLR